MSGKQYEIGIQINGDGSVFVREAARSEKAAVKLGEAVGGIEKSTHGLNDSAARATIGIGQLADQVGSVGRLFSALVVAPALISSIRDTGKALFDASASAERLRTQLAFSTGNADREFDFLLKLSNRLGLEFRSTAQAYAGFAAASRDTALEGQAARDVFEAIAKASAVMGLSAEQSSGALLAIQQMMSKGVVSAEEFRGQLGERMPIALQAGAKALGVTASEFSKLMESGKIVSDEFLPKFARAITETLGDAPEKAANRLDASTARMANAWDRLKQAGGDSGVSKAIASDMNALAATANAMTESMAQSAQRGEGSLLQFANAAGVLIGRSTLGGIAATAETVNGSINLLSGGMFRLSTNISLLPDSLRPAAEQLTSIDGKLKTARTEYEALAERVGKAPENIYLRSELAQLGNYIARLKEARSQQALLSGVGLPENYGNEGRGATQQKAADDAALAASQKRAKAYAEVIEKYQTPAEKMGKALREAKESLGEFFTPDVERRIRESFKKGDAGLANDASQIFQARLATEKDYISTSVKLIAEKVRQNVLTEREGFEQTAAIQQAGYVAQAKLLKQRLAETTDKGEREKLKQQIIALGNDAQEAAEKSATGIMLIAEKELKAQQEYSHGLASETEALLQKAKAADFELGTIGLSAERLAELTARRYDEQIAIKTAEADRLRESQGREADVHLIELQIDALTRLKSAEITKTKLQEQAREWDSFSRDIQRSLTDSLYRGLEKGGKDGAKLARDTITNSLKAIPLKLFVQAVINPVMNGAQQVLGIGGGNGAAGSVGSLASLYNAYSSWSNAGGIGGLGTAAGNWFGQAFGDAAYAANSGAYAQGFSAGLYGGQGMAAEYSKYALEMSNAGNYAAAGAYQQAADAAGQGASQGSSLSSGLGYAGAVYALTQGRYGQAVGTAIGTAIMPGIGTVIGSTLGSFVDSFTSSGGAPKSMFGGGGRITSSGVVYDPTGQAHWTDYTEQSKSLASAILTEQLVGALRKINAGYAGGGAYVKGELNLKGSSSNQTVAQATSSSGQVIYHRYTEAGKGTEDFQKFVAEEIPRLQLALVVDAMRTAGGEIQKIANSVVGSSTDLTEALAQIDASATISQLDQLAGVFNLIRTNIDSRITGEATVALAKLAGGAQALSASVNAYYNNYFSQEEKAARLQQQMTEAFTRLGLVVPTTRAGFRVLVDGLDKTTSAGQETFTALMSLQDAFGQVADAAEATAKTSAEAAARKAADAESVLRDSYDRYASALDATRTKFDGFAKSLLSFRQQLMFGELSTLSPYEKYQQAAKAFRDISRRSALGDEAAIEQLQSASQSFLEASRSYNASNEQYARDFAEVQAALTRTADVAQRQASIAAEQLVTLRQQVSALIDIRDGIGGLSDDLGSLASAVLSAMSGVSAARALQQQPQKPAGNSATASIVAAYQASLGRAPDASGLAYWQNQAAAGVSADTISAAIAASPEAQVNSLYQSVLGRSADASGQSYWMAQIASGVSADTVAAAMRSSDEYRNSHAAGLEVVPFHGYRAVLHKDEAVVDAQSVAAIRRYFGAQVAVTTQRQGNLSPELSDLVVEIRASIEQSGTVAKAMLDRLENLAGKVDEQTRTIRRAA